MAKTTKPRVPHEPAKPDAGNKTPDMAQFITDLQRKIDAGNIPVAHENVSLGGEVDSFGSYELENGGERFDQEQFILFFLSEQPYGFPINSVIEIIRPLPITQIPNAPHGIEGLVNLRGRTLPIIDLATWLDLTKSQEKSSKGRVIVFQSEGEPVGLIVDEVAEVIGFNSESIDRPDSLSEAVHSANVRGYAQYQNLVVTLLESVEMAA